MVCFTVKFCLFCQFILNNLVQNITCFDMLWIWWGHFGLFHYCSLKLCFLKEMVHAENLQNFLQSQINFFNICDFEDNPVQKSQLHQIFLFPIHFSIIFPKHIVNALFFPLNQRNNNQKPSSTVRIKNGGIGSRIFTDVSVGCCYLDLYVLVDNLFLPLGRIFFHGVCWNIVLGFTIY